MPERVLPSSRVLSVIREAVGDELVNLGERQHLVPRRPYRHRRQRYVRVGRFLITVGIARGSRHHRRRFQRVRISEIRGGKRNPTRPEETSNARRGDSHTCRDPCQGYSRASILRTSAKRGCPPGTRISIGGPEPRAEARARKKSQK